MVKSEPSPAGPPYLAAVAVHAEAPARPERTVNTPKYDSTSALSDRFRRALIVNDGTLRPCRRPTIRFALLSVLAQPFGALRDPRLAQLRQETCFWNRHVDVHAQELSEERWHLGARDEYVENSRRALLSESLSSSTARALPLPILPS